MGLPFPLSSAEDSAHTASEASMVRLGECWEGETSADQVTAYIWRDGEIKEMYWWRWWWKRGRLEWTHGDWAKLEVSTWILIFINTEIGVCVCVCACCRLASLEANIKIQFGMQDVFSGSKHTWKETDWAGDVKLQCRPRRALVNSTLEHIQPVRVVAYRTKNISLYDLSGTFSCPPQCVCVCVHVYVCMYIHMFPNSEKAEAMKPQ